MAELTAMPVPVIANSARPALRIEIGSATELAAAISTSSPCLAKMPSRKAV